MPPHREKRIGRVIPVTRLRQTKDSMIVEGTHYRVARATPTQEQIERAIMGRTATAGAKAVLALIQELEGGESDGIS